MRVLWLVAVVAVLGSSPCSEGVGETAPEKTVGGVEELESGAVESPRWFFRRFVGSARPVLLRQAGGPEELWSDLFLLHKAGGEAEVRVTTLRAKKDKEEGREEKVESLESFLGRYLRESADHVVMRAPLPESLQIGAGEVERRAVPCLEEGGRVGLARELVMGAGGGKSGAVEAVARDVLIRVVAGERVVRVGPPGSERGRKKRNKEGEWEAEAFEEGSFGEVVVRKDEVLFVPALWFRQSFDYCRHVSVETSFDVRRLTQPPFLETWLNSRRSLDAIYAQMLRLQVEESGACPDLDTASDHAERKAAWKRRALFVTAVGVAVVGVAMVQVVKGMRADAIEKKSK